MDQEEQEPQERHRRRLLNLPDSTIHQMSTAAMVGVGAVVGAGAGLAWLGTKSPAIARMNSGIVHGLGTAAGVGAYGTYRAGAWAAKGLGRTALKTPYRVAETAASLWHWARAGKPTTFVNARGFRQLNTSLRNKILFGMAVAGTVAFVGRNRQHYEDRMVGKQQNIESRRMDDLGATGDMALAMQMRDVKYAMRSSLVHFI